MPIDLPRPATRPLASSMTRAALTALGLALPAAPAIADGYIMGAGRWSCAEVVRVVDEGNAALIGQSAGWVLAWWSAATFQRETGFVDIVEQVGGETIWRKTVAECRNAPGDTMLYLVANSMISNTK